MSALLQDSALQVLEGGAHNLGSLMALLRDGSQVKRWHAERVAAQSVAEHSHGVATLLCFLTEPSVSLLKAALFHDLAERSVGDMPAPIKWDYPNIAEFLDELSEKVERQLGIYVILTPNEKKILKIADYLDAAFFALEQRKCGNQNAEGIFIRLRWFFESQIDMLTYPKALVVWEWLKKEYDKASA